MQLFIALTEGNCWRLGPESNRYGAKLQGILFYLFRSFGFFFITILAQYPLAFGCPKERLKMALPEAHFAIVKIIHRVVPKNFP